MDDLVTVSLLTASVFFVVLAFGLLFRYRQVSKQITSSNDLGRDLWGALESRMKKQDERILDMMGRVEVIQSRTLQDQVSGNEGLTPTGEQSPQDLVTPKSPGTDGTEPAGNAEMEVTHEAIETSHVTPHAIDIAVGSAENVEAQLKLQDAHILDLIGKIELIESRLRERPSTAIPPSTRRLEEEKPLGTSFQERESTDKVSEKVLLEMLLEKPRTSVEIRERFGITREHAARVLKGLFDRGIVVRNDKHKPFVYELTDMGRQSIGNT
jgi:predicted transcriptional regulator